jgi:Kazal-type serine protease inhibitor domain
MRSLMVLIGFVFLFVWPVAPLSAAMLGQTCDGIAAIRCDEGLLCEHQGGWCNVADGSGTCVNGEAKACHPVDRPVCGCDGTTYRSDCERRRAMAQLDHEGECAKER